MMVIKNIYSFNLNNLLSVSGPIQKAGGVGGGGGGGGGGGSIRFRHDPKSERGAAIKGHMER